MNIPKMQSIIQDFHFRLCISFCPAGCKRLFHRTNLDKSSGTGMIQVLHNRYKDMQVTLEKTDAQDQ